MARQVPKAQLFPLLELRANQLLWQNDTGVRLRRQFELEERHVQGAGVVGQPELVRAQFVWQPQGQDDEITEDDLLRITQGYLATLTTRRFRQRNIPNAPLYTQVQIVVRNLRADGRWSTYRYMIPLLMPMDIFPVGSVLVDLHQHVHDAYMYFADQLNAEGSDPDVLDVLNLRQVTLYVTFTRTASDGILTYHTANVQPLVGVLVAARRYTEVTLTLGRNPEWILTTYNRNQVVPGLALVRITPYLPMGGCKDYVQDILDLSVIGRHRPDEHVPPLKRRRGNSIGVQVDLNNMRVWCPNVKNNNCFFACVKHACALEASKDNSIQSPAATERIDTWRKRMGIPNNKMISFQHIDMFVRRIFRRTIHVFDEHGKLMAEIVPDYQDGQPPFEFVLFREHYFVLLDRTLTRYHCDLCGRRNLKTLENHKCGVNRAKFFQLKKKKVVQFLDTISDQDLPVPAHVLSTLEKWPNMLFFDFETFFDGTGHRVYAVGCLHWNENSEETYFSFYGEPALENFIMFLEHEYERNQSLTLVSYNGAGFDHYFILEHHIRSLTTPEGFLLSRGRLLQVNFWGHKCLDLYNFLGPSSLDANCAAYQVPVRKHVFPHLFPRSFDDVTYKGPVLADEHYPEKMRDDVRKWKATLEQGYVFDFEKESEFYLQRDVECLMELSKRFLKSVWTEFHIYLPNYLTLSQMAFDLWRQTLDKSWSLPLPIEEPFYNAINAATYGGRCHFVKRFYRSAQPDFTPYAEIDDYLIDLDVVSLYPASMRNHLYPVGNYVHWHDVRSVQTWTEKFNSGCPMPLAIWRVSVECPKHFIVSPLPKKHDERKTTCWENTNSESQWYTSVDLEIGREHGYSFLFHEGYVWEQSAPVFDTYIEMMFQRKAQQDVFKATRDPQYNPAARDVFKKLMNALYGKMMQKRQSTSHMFMESNGHDDNVHDQWVDFLEDHMGVEYKEMGDMLLVTGERVDFTAGISKPHYLGAFVLSYSRQIMNSYFDMLDPFRLNPGEGTWLDSMDHSFFYTDTDSLIVHAKHMDRVRDKLGSELGMLADELSGGKILEGYFLAPKLYCVKYKLADESIHFKLRGKGIPNALLHIDHFRDMLMDNEPVKYEFTQLRKVQADLNRKQEEQGVQPFSIVSLLSASRTLNRQRNYAEAGLLGGRVVLKDVALSLPIGFEKYDADLEDVWRLFMEEETEEARALDEALRNEAKLPDRDYVNAMEDKNDALWSPMVDLLSDRWEDAMLSGLE